ncbi:MAG: hypothetical protein ACPG7E_06715 [Marinirhabdus sp.]
MNTVVNIAFAVVLSIMGVQPKGGAVPEPKNVTGAQTTCKKTEPSISTEKTIDAYQIKTNNHTRKSTE